MPVRGLNNQRPLNLDLSFPVTEVRPTSPSQPARNTTSLPSLGTDRSTTNEVVLSPAAREKATRGLDKLYNTLRTTLNHDAESLARGEMPVRAGDELSETQRETIRDATVEMLKEMPIGALSPRATESLKKILDKHDIDTTNLDTKTIGDLGDVGKELAETLIKDLKTDNPAAFYGIAAAAAAAVGTYGYLEGSEKLREMGLKPEFTTHLFDKSLEVKAEADWGKKFSDPNLRLNTRGTTSLGNLMIGHSLSYDTRNADNVSGTLDARLGKTTGNNLGFSTSGDLEKGFGETKVDGRYSFGEHTVLKGNARFDGDFGLTSANLNTASKLNDSANLGFNLNLGEDAALRDLSSTLDYKGDNWALNSHVKHRFEEGITDARLTGHVKPLDNLRIDANANLSTDAEDYLTLKSTGTSNLGENLTLKHNMGYDTRNADNLTGDFDLRYGDKNYIGLTAAGDLEGGLDKASIYGRTTLGKNTTLNGRANFDGDLGLTSANFNTVTNFNDSGSLKMDLSLAEGGALKEAGASLGLKGNNWNFSGNVRHNFMDDYSTGGLKASYTPSENFEASAFGELDTRGESRIGVGVTWRF